VSLGGDLQNQILHVIERWWAGRYTERHGIVSAYDPKNYLAKVTFQPEGQESGWLPIETGHIGDGYGIAIGLQPGAAGMGADGTAGSAQGSGQQGNQGDQVIVRYQEGDIESGKIVQRVHSDEDKPPEVQSGELVIWCKFQKSGGGTPDSADGGQGGDGQKFWMKKDGSTYWEDGNGATLTFDGKGNATLKCKKLNVNASDAIDIEGAKTILIHGAQDININGDANINVHAQQVLNLNGDQILNLQGGGPVSPPFSVAP
jgi:phage baseplate assembly protein gpV